VLVDERQRLRVAVAVRVDRRLEDDRPLTICTIARECESRCGSTPTM
jgi:hypothetical protein